LKHQIKKNYYYCPSCECDDKTGSLGSHCTLHHRCIVGQIASGWYCHALCYDAVKGDSIQDFCMSIITKMFFYYLRLFCSRCSYVPMITSWHCLLGILAIIFYYAICYAITSFLGGTLFLAIL